MTTATGVYIHPVGLDLDLKPLPPDHDSAFHVTGTPVLTTLSSVTHTYSEIIFVGFLIHKGYRPWAQRGHQAPAYSDPLRPILFLFLRPPLHMRSGCHLHQIRMNYPFDAIFKMAALKIGDIMFLPITQ